MAERNLLKAKRRDVSGTRHCRRLRRQGAIPAVVYGHGFENIMVVISEEELLPVLQAGARVVTLDLGGTRENVLIREVQHSSLGDSILHVDLARVSLDERITVSVSVRLKGTPVGMKEGGIVDQPLRQLEIETLATQIPDALELDISPLAVGEALLVKDVPVPPGVKVLNDPSLIVASVMALAAEEVVVAPVGEVAEPELIRKERKEEEEELEERTEQKPPKEK